MKSLIKTLPFAAIAFSAPLFASAQTLDWFNQIATEFGEIVGILIPILIALAFLVFVWGLITFILSSGDEAAKDEGKRRMIWGVIALFVIVSIWGIIGLLQTITSTDGGAATYPEWKVS